MFKGEQRCRVVRQHCRCERPRRSRRPCSCSSGVPSPPAPPGPPFLCPPGVPPPPPPATITPIPPADTLLFAAEPGQNYGGAGAVAIAGTGSPQGEFQSLIKFDLGPARAAFDAAYGVGN